MRLHYFAYFPSQWASWASWSTGGCANDNVGFVRHYLVASEESEACFLLPLWKAVGHEFVSTKVPMRTAMVSHGIFLKNSVKEVEDDGERMSELLKSRRTRVLTITHPWFGTDGSKKDGRDTRQ